MRSGAGARRARAWGLFVLPALAGLAAGGGLHTQLDSSDPADGARLSEPPDRVALDFSTDVQLALSTVSVRLAESWAAGGTPESARVVAAGALRYDADDRRDVLVLPLAELLASGVYAVAWTTAGPDSHPISGEFGFEVGTPTATQQADSQPPQQAGIQEAEGPRQSDDPAGGGLSFAVFLSIAARLLFYMGTVGLIGALAFRVLVLAPVERAGGTSAVPMLALAWTWQIATMSVAALLASIPLRLWHQARTLFPDDPFGNLAALSQTAWGGGWWLHVGAGLVAAAGMWLARPLGERARGWAVAAVGVLLLPVVAAVSGHAWATQPRGLAVAALYLHVLAASMWLGGLFCLVFAGIRALRTTQAADGGALVASGPASLAFVEVVVAFSRLAVVAVALLVVTGTANAWLRLDAVSQLWSTPWGRTLLVKASLAVATMAIGLYNWRVVRPALMENPRPGVLQRPALLELALGAAALIATSWLVVQSLG